MRAASEGLKFAASSDGAASIVSASFSQAWFEMQKRQ
jgi:hypothetical protein